MTNEEKVIEAMKTIKQYCEQFRCTCKGCILYGGVTGCKADRLPFSYSISDNTVDREKIAKKLGNLGDFEEIISDGDLPF